MPLAGRRPRGACHSVTSAQDQETFSERQAGFDRWQETTQVRTVPKHTRQIFGRLTFAVAPFLLWNVALEKFRMGVEFAILGNGAVFRPSVETLKVVTFGSSRQITKRLDLTFRSSLCLSFLL